MPKSQSSELDPTILQYIKSEKQWQCLVCPVGRAGLPIKLRPSGLQAHIESSKHQRAVHNHKETVVQKPQSSNRRDATTQPATGSPSSSSRGHHSSTVQEASDSDMMTIMDALNELTRATPDDQGPSAECTPELPSHIPTVSPNDIDVHMDEFQTLDGIKFMDTSASRFYQDLLTSLERGDLVSTCRLANDIAGTTEIGQDTIEDDPEELPEIPDAQKTAVLEWAKALGANNVPSLYAIKNCQAQIMKLVSDPTEKVVSKSGTVFYINDVANSIAKDYANPITRSSMEDYPIDAGESMMQACNARKMLLDLPPDIGPPTVRVDDTIYFVHELLQLRSGSFFIPERFFRIRTNDKDDQSDGLYALGWPVRKTSDGFSVDLTEDKDDNRVITRVDQFAVNYPELVQRLNGPATFTDSFTHWQDKMPHPLRDASNGRMVYAVPIIIFMDDVSGNISKQWNKHHVVYMSNANMPREMIDQEFCVRFVSSSPHATPMELMDALKTSVKYVASEFSVGGTQEYKRSNEGYESLYHSGSLRTAESTRQEVLQQFEMGTQAAATTKLKERIKTTGCSDTSTKEILDFLSALGIKMRLRTDKKDRLAEPQVFAHLEAELKAWLHGETKENRINPLLGMRGVDIHADTPTEILHTFLLGVVKYLWAQTVEILDDNSLLKTFSTRLASLDTSGMQDADLRADYLIRHRNSLIGKYFKSLAQVMPFLIYDLISASILNAWTVVGRLVVLIWHTTIHDTEVYLADLSRTIEDFLNFKHVVTGGYWYNLQTKQWTCAGPAVTEYLSQHSGLARLLGLKSKEHNPPGTVTFIRPDRKKPVKSTVQWSQSKCAAVPDPHHSDTTTYNLASSLIAQNGDKAQINSYVAYQDVNGKTVIGKTSQILTTKETAKDVGYSYVAIDAMQFLGQLHSLLHLPILQATGGVSVVPAQVQQQEREETQVTKEVLRHKHSDDDRYLLNCYVVHNYDIISQAVPEHLRSADLLVPNGQIERQKAAERLRKTHSGKKSKKQITQKALKDAGINPTKKKR
ncbi:hypothetical protein EIP86_008993 [Pleurotus ostreatoroseus]|nr:hypothetical protein EIP86_008993 [Pleurotus ostreatoroseus]